MIADKDRSGWFGASDTSFIMGSWTTKSFEKWWLIKLGLIENNFSNKYMNAGTYYEHKIIDALGIKVEKDKQILIPELRMRVNLDANTTDTIHEIKTFKEAKGFKKPPQKYIEQVIVQMFASGFRKAYIDAYPMTEEHYKNYFIEIEPEKIKCFPVEYDERFIDDYFPRIKYLKECLNKGVFPDGRYNSHNHSREQRVL